MGVLKKVDERKKALPLADRDEGEKTGIHQARTCSVLNRGKSPHPGKPLFVFRENQEKKSAGIKIDPKNHR